MQEILYKTYHAKSVSCRMYSVECVMQNMSYKMYCAKYDM